MLTKDELRQIILEEITKSELEEGFLDRLRAKGAGLGAKVDQFGKNVGSVGRAAKAGLSGDADAARSAIGQVSSPSKAGQQARNKKLLDLYGKHFQKVLTKMHKDVQSFDDADLRSNAIDAMKNIYSSIKSLKGMQASSGGPDLDPAVEPEMSPDDPTKFSSASPGSSMDSPVVPPASKSVPSASPALSKAADPLPSIEDDEDGVDVNLGDLDEPAPPPPTPAKPAPAPAVAKPSAPAPAPAKKAVAKKAVAKKAVAKKAVAKPSAPAPAVAKPSAPAPAVAKPSAPAPAVAKPSAPAPAVAKPSAPAPAVAKPSAPAPAVAKPSAPAPAVAKPSAPAPAVAKPSAPAPAVAKPSAPAPAVAKPSAPAPAVAKPSAPAPAKRFSAADVRAAGSKPAVKTTSEPPVDKDLDMEDDDGVDELDFEPSSDKGKGREKWKPSPPPKATSPEEAEELAADIWQNTPSSGEMWVPKNTPESWFRDMEDAGKLYVIDPKKPRHLGKYAAYDDESDEDFDGTDRLPSDFDDEDMASREKMMQNYKKDKPAPATDTSDSPSAVAADSPKPSAKQKKTSGKPKRTEDVPDFGGRAPGERVQVPGARRPPELRSAIKSAPAGQEVDLSKYLTATPVAVQRAKEQGWIEPTENPSIFKVLKEFDLEETFGALQEEGQGEMKLSSSCPSDIVEKLKSLGYVS